MLNQNVKIVYSLRVHIALQKMGFQHLTEMKNPNNPYLNCWVYEETEAFKTAFNRLLEEANDNG